jgi:hypothetical protein
MGKFQTEDDDYFEFLRWLQEAPEVTKKDCVTQIGCFAGHVNFARYLAVYELYKKVAHLPGDLIEVGVWKGQMLLYLSKLLTIFEPHNYSIAVGCDLFDGLGMQPGKDDPGFGTTGQYGADQAFLEGLISRQRIKNVRLEKMDSSRDFPNYFEKYPQQFFRLVFLDCGVYEVVKHSIEHLLPRIVPGGILMLDQFAIEGAPGEAKAVMELLREYKFQALPWTRSPNLYIVKEGARTPAAPPPGSPGS